MPAKTANRFDTTTRESGTAKTTAKKTSSKTDRASRFAPRTGPTATSAMTSRSAAELVKALAALEDEPAMGKRRRARHWSGEENTAATSKIKGARSGAAATRPLAEPARGAAAGAVAVKPGSWEQERQFMIRDRNRARRYPWVPGAAAVAAGLLAQQLAALFAWLTPVPAEHVVAVAAGAPILVAVVVGLRQRTAAWLPDITVAGLGAAAIVWWIGTAGMSWPVVLVVLVATIVGGARWWREHPMGPDVAALEPPLREQRTAAPVVVAPHKDPHVLAWKEKNASGNGKAKNSKLTNRCPDEFTITYDVELDAGVQTIEDLVSNHKKLAGGLGLPATKVVFKRAPEGSSENQARLTIITKDPVAKIRYFTAPRVDDGIIKGVARAIDGSGEVDITMWDDTGTVPTMIVGSTGGGKSGAANEITASALSTGLLNLAYFDPKGNSSTAMAKWARLSLIGEAACLKAPILINAMMAARGQLAAEMGVDKFFPTLEVPGWMFLHDEYSVIASDAIARTVWTKTVNTVRALGIWPVALNQSQGMQEWGSDHARSAFASQVIAFRTNSKSSSDLVPGLLFDPNDLPMNEKGRPVPGMAVHAYQDCPVRWDFLPSDADAARMITTGQPAPPYTVSSAFAEFFRQPEVHQADVRAIESVLGPAKNGRWQVGGGQDHATHTFPDTTSTTTSSGPAKRKTGGWGALAAAAATGPKLTPSQVEILEIVRDGTTESGAIVAAATTSRATAFASLRSLVDLGLIAKLAQGDYRAIAQNT